MSSAIVDYTHAATTQLLNNAVVRDGLADHAQACYGGSVGKSMKAEEFPVSKQFKCHRYNVCDFEIRMSIPNPVRFTPLKPT
jgi:hypothetical protein